MNIEEAFAGWADESLALARLAARFGDTFAAATDFADDDEPARPVRMVPIDEADFEW